MSKRALRYCRVCGVELPKGSGRGAPRSYCQPTTGRPCREFAKRWEWVLKVVGRILASTPSAARDRARYRLRGFVTDLVDEISAARP